MRKIILASMAVAAFSLAACSEKAKEETSEAAGAVADDAAAAGDKVAYAEFDRAELDAKLADGAHSPAM